MSPFRILAATLVLFTGLQALPAAIRSTPSRTRRRLP